MRVIGRNSPKTALGAIGVDLRASYPPETSACEDIARLLQRGAAPAGFCYDPLTGSGLARRMARRLRRRV